MAEKRGAPDYKTQKEVIQPLLEQRLTKGAAWYLVDIRWMKQWKKYVGYDRWDQSLTGVESANPGPIDTADLFKDVSNDKLKEHLMEELDYALMPAPAWEKMTEWYRTTTGSRPICRVVRGYGLFMKHLKVEVYRLEFKLCVHPKINETITREFSRVDTVAQLEATMRGIFNIPSPARCRVWYHDMTRTYELFPNPQQTLGNVGLYNGQDIMIEVENEDGTWPYHLRPGTSRMQVQPEAQRTPPKLKKKDKNVHLAPEARKQEQSKTRPKSSKRKAANLTHSEPRVEVVSSSHEVDCRQQQSMETQRILPKLETVLPVPNWSKEQEQARKSESSESGKLPHSMPEVEAVPDRYAANLQRRVEGLQRKVQEQQQQTLQEVQRQLQEQQQQTLQELQRKVQEQQQQIAEQITQDALQVQRTFQEHQQLCTAEKQKLQNALTEQEERAEILAQESEIAILQQQERAERSERESQELQVRVQELQKELQEQKQQLENAERHLLTAQFQSQQQQQQIQILTDRAEESDRLNQQQRQQIDSLTARAEEAEHLAQEMHERKEEMEGRAVQAETRLQHSDQVFQDMLQRLTGQLPQSLPPWAVQRNEIQLTDERLGAGGWAVVKVAYFRGKRVAAKCLHNKIISSHNIRLFTREMNMAAQGRHPNLLQFIGATMDNEPVILTELIPTSLRGVMETGTQLGSEQVSSIASDVAQALNYLHLMNPEPIIHRDVSSANVLLEPCGPSRWRAKVSDYGSANFVRYTTTAGPGNPLYAAPEATDPHRHSPKMDVYSFGILLVEMCSGELPASCEELIRRIQWPQMVTTIRQCIRQDPLARPSMADIIVELNRPTV